MAHLQKQSLSWPHLEAGDLNNIIIIIISSSTIMTIIMCTNSFIIMRPGAGTRARPGGRPRDEARGGFAKLPSVWLVLYVLLLLLVVVWVVVVVVVVVVVAIVVLVAEEEEQQHVYISY